MGDMYPNRALLYFSIMFHMILFNPTFGSSLCVYFVIVCSYYLLIFNPIMLVYCLVHYNFLTLVFYCACTNVSRFIWILIHYTWFIWSISHIYRGIWLNNMDIWFVLYILLHVSLWYTLYWPFHERLLHCWSVLLMNKFSDQPSMKLVHQCDICVWISWGITVKNKQF